MADRSLPGETPGSGVADQPGAEGPPAAPAPGRRALAWAGAVSILAAGAWLALRDPAAGGYPVCAIRNLTGWECAACGGLRAVHQALHGRLGAALGLNPLAVLALPVAALLVVSELRVGLGRSPLRTGIRPGHWLWIVPAALLAFMVLRNIL